jgi:hypothetical protein
MTTPRESKMKYVKPELTSEELEVLEELIKIASIGCLKEITLLNARQSEIGKVLQKKGYVRLMKQKFMVLMAA